MNLSALGVFIEAVRRGSFTAVARDYDVSPSAISRTIATLEDELGIRLFQRTTRRLSLTEAGVVYFGQVEPLVEEIKRANLAAADVSQRPKGVLRVTSSVSFGQKCIVPLLPDFAAAYPELTVDLLLTDSIVDLLTERIDIAVRLGSLPDSTLIAHRLFQTTYSVYASPEYLARRGWPKTPGELKSHNCLLFPLPGFRSRWIFRDANGGIVEIPVEGRVVISNALALHQCARAGMGVALLPHWIVGADLRRKVLTNVFPRFDVTATEFDTAAWLLYPSRDYLPIKVRAFADFLKRRLRGAAPPRGQKPG
ncbi:MAG: LysR family transcriptional regulator [Rhodospirillales bacterium]|nr:LysR family transcriptional regulator [Rhodospirillales bacterium]